MRVFYTCLNSFNHLFYGDETGTNKLAYVTYGWQKKGENLAISVNCGK